MTDTADKIEAEAPAQPSAAEEAVSSDKADSVKEIEKNGEADAATAEASESKGLDASKHAPKEEAATDDRPENGETTDEKLKDEKPKANDSAKRKASDTDGKDSKKSKIDYKDYSKNIKSDYTALPDSSDPDEIRKQVEFYFSDSNLYQDKYLNNLVGGSNNNSVPIKTIHGFKRMQRFQPYSAVLEALKESETLELVHGDEIRRRVPLEAQGDKTQEEYIKTFDDKTVPRSIYAKGFGDETPTTQFDIEDFFAPYGPINAIRLRRTNPYKVFKGSVFVEFDCEETQQEFLNLDPKPKFQGIVLDIKSKKEYCDGKLEDIRTGKIKPNEHQYDRGRNNGRNDRGGRGFRGGRGGRDRRGGRDHGDRDADDWKGRRSDFQRNGWREEREPRKCYICGKEGHRKYDCPDKDKGNNAGDEKDKAARAVESKSPQSKKKRSREDDEDEKAGDGGVKSKSDVAPPTESKKRAREDNGEDVDASEAKKVKNGEVEAAA